MRDLRLRHVHDHLVDIMLSGFLQASPSWRCIYLARGRSRDQLAADLGDKASEAALSGNPSRARYYEEWASRAESRS